MDISHYPKILFLSSLFGLISFFKAYPQFYFHKKNMREYELKDHLGNLSVIIPDIKNPVDKNDLSKGFFSPIKNYCNYFPFGMEQLNRTYFSDNYRFGFSGKEKDKEIKGSGNSYDFGARIYDSRGGRWLSVEPLIRNYPGLSPFVFAGNNPILFKDVDGNEFFKYNAEYYLDRAQNVMLGTAKTAGGIVQGVGGAALMLAPTGATQVLGAALVINGSLTAASGVEQIGNQFSSAPSAPLLIPTGLGQIAGKGIDQATGNENHTFETVGNVGDAVLSFAGGSPKVPTIPGGLAPALVVAGGNASKAGAGVVAVLGGPGAGGLAGIANTVAMATTGGGGSKTEPVKKAPIDRAMDIVSSKMEVNRMRGEWQKLFNLKKTLNPHNPIDKLQLDHIDQEMQALRPAFEAAEKTYRQALQHLAEVQAAKLADSFGKLKNEILGDAAAKK